MSQGRKKNGGQVTNQTEVRVGESSENSEFKTRSILLSPESLSASDTTSDHSSEPSAASPITSIPSVTCTSNCAVVKAPPAAKGTRKQRFHRSSLSEAGHELSEASKELEKNETQSRKHSKESIDVNSNALQEIQLDEYPPTNRVKSQKSSSSLLDIPNTGASDTVLSFDENEGGEVAIEASGDSSSPSFSDSVDSEELESYSKLTEADMPADLRSHVFKLKAIYFLLAFNSSTWGRFGTIYYTEKGLSTKQIGILAAVVPAIQVFAMPLWGVISDKLRSRKTVSLFTTSCSMSILLLLAFPQIARDFESILTITILMACFVSSGVLDAHTLDVLGTKYSHLYGRIRLWAAVAWGIGALFMGLLNMEFGFLPNFILYACLTVCSLFAVYKVLPKQTESEKSTKATEVKFAELFRAMIQPRMLFFMFQMTIFGALMSIVDRLLFVFIEKDLKGSTLLCGVTVSVTVLFELPVFFYAGALSKKIGRHGMFAVAMVSQTIRLYGYTLLTEETKWWILSMEILHGITFACMWSAAVDYARAMLPKAWASTAQTILGAILDCIGGGTGAIIGGWVMDKHGGKYMYFHAAFIGVATFAIHLVYMLRNGLGREHVLVEAQNAKFTESIELPPISPIRTSEETSEEISLEVEKESSGNNRLLDTNVEDSSFPVQ